MNVWRVLWSTLTSCLFRAEIDIIINSIGLMWVNLRLNFFSEENIDTEFSFERKVIVKRKPFKGKHQKCCDIKKVNRLYGFN